MGGASGKRVPFAPSPHDIIDRMLSLADPKPDELLVDLGSGDGRVVISASKRYGCKAVGVEINPKLASLSSERISKMWLEERARVVLGDFHSFDFSRADIVTLYLLPSALRALAPKFKMLRRGARVVSHDYRVPGMEPDEVYVAWSPVSGRRHVIYLYVMR